MTLAALQNGERVLDVACGTGVLAPAGSNASSPGSKRSKIAREDDGIDRLRSIPTHTSLPSRAAAVKDKPFGRPQEGAEPKNATKQEDKMPSDQLA